MKQLVKLNLIEEGDKRYFGSSIKKVWKITPQGQGFKLPPRAFWARNDPAS